MTSIILTLEPTTYTKAYRILLVEATIVVLSPPRAPQESRKAGA